jgi:hypothetical protein
MKEPRGDGWAGPAGADLGDGARRRRVTEAPAG